MTFSCQTIASDLLTRLQPRPRDILTRRFGLAQGEPETLEAIGQIHGVTRERVRQIAQDALAQVKEGIAGAKERRTLERAFKQFASVLEESGGLKREDLLAGELGAPEEANSIVFLLHLGNGFYKHRETENVHPFWASREKIVQAGLGLLAALVAYLAERKEVADFEQLREAHPAHEGERVDPRMLASLLEVSKHIAQTHKGAWGLREWPEVCPKGMREKAYVVLREHGKPLHFMEVARFIERLQESLAEERKKNVFPQTVHNELIKDPRFVLVGRGTYGLADWGLKPGTVKDVILQILQENGGALTKEEILEKTLSQRQVKESTVILSLQDKTCFTRDGDRYYCVSS